MSDPIITVGRKDKANAAIHTPNMTLNDISNCFLESALLSWKQSNAGLQLRRAIGTQPGWNKTTRERCYRAVSCKALLGFAFD